MNIITPTNALRSTTRGGKAVRFFEPTEEFFSLMDELNPARAKVIDCGSSHGLLANELRQRGYDALGIDLFPACATVLRLDATEFSYPVGSVVLIARPCHSDWVEKTIRHALKTASMVVYIGLDHNKDVDIPAGDEFMTREDDDRIIGNDGEVAVIFRKRKTNVMTFVLIKSHHASSWYLKSDEVGRGGVKYRNPNGGFIYLCSEDEILETVEAESFEDLDWTKTYLNKPDANAGWISPTGQFFGCGFEYHDDCATYILKKTVSELEDGGWCRLWPDGFSCSREITPEQKRTLISKGASFDEHGHCVITPVKPATLTKPHEGD